MSRATVEKWGNNLAIRVPTSNCARFWPKRRRAGGNRNARRRYFDTPHRRPSPQAQQGGRGCARDHWREQTLFAGRSLNPRPHRGRPPRVSIVLDASMTIAWLFADEGADAAHAIMLRVVSSGAVVPSLWRLEVAKCCVMLSAASAATRPMSIAPWNGSADFPSRSTTRPACSLDHHASLVPQAGADTLRRRVSRAGHPQVPAARHMRCGAHGRGGPVRTRGPHRLSGVRMGRREAIRAAAGEHHPRRFHDHRLN